MIGGKNEKPILKRIKKEFYEIGILLNFVLSRFFKPGLNCLILYYKP